MTRALPALLLCAALALGGILYLETEPNQPGLDAGEPKAGPTAELVRPSQRAPTENIAPWVATILARPLFSPTRRPPAAVASAGPVKPATEMPRLSGVLVSEAGRAAIFAYPGQKPTIAHPGDQIGPYRITSISEGAVTLAGPAGSVTMHPSFANTGERPVAAPAGPPSPLRPTSAPPVAIPSISEVQRMLARQQEEAPK